MQGVLLGPQHILLLEKLELLLAGFPLQLLFLSHRFLLFGLPFGVLCGFLQGIKFLRFFPLVSIDVEQPLLGLPQI
jgi:hypothetical protein